MQNRIRLFTSVLDDCQLLKSFLEFYTIAGVTHFHIVVNEHNSRGLSQQVRDVVRAAPGAELARVIDSPKADMCEELDALRREVTAPDEFIVLADLDEFVEFPAPLAFFIAWCRKRSFEWVRGHLLDRVTEDGHIPRILQADIWSQFPLVGHLMPRRFKSNRNKCVLQRAVLPITLGHHGQPGNHRCGPNVLPVHHFKWLGDIRGRLASRIRVERLNNHSWAGVAEAMLAYLECNGGAFNIMDPENKLILRPRLKQAGTRH